MAQMTWRSPDDLLEHVRAQAAAHGRSLNEWVTTVMRAATDPATADSEASRIRERLARAGVLDTSAVPTVEMPDPERVRQARAAAGRGTSLSDFVRHDRR